MLERFLRYFGEKDTFHYNGDLYRDFLTQFGGRSFGNGLFRVFKPEAVPEWTQTVFEAFPWVKPTYRLFAYDWFGCVMATAKRVDGRDIIASFDLSLDEAGYELLVYMGQFERFFMADGDVQRVDPLRPYPA